MFWVCVLNILFGLLILGASAVHGAHVASLLGIVAGAMLTTAGVVGVTARAAARVAKEGKP